MTLYTKPSVFGEPTNGGTLTDPEYAYDLVANTYATLRAAAGTTTTVELNGFADAVIASGRLWVTKTGASPWDYSDDGVNWYTPSNQEYVDFYSGFNPLLLFVRFAASSFTVWDGSQFVTTYYDTQIIDVSFEYEPLPVSKKKIAVNNSI